LVISKKVREIRIPSEEPYKKVILNYLNKVLDPKSTFWTKKIKYQVQEKFPECLSELEMDVKSDLKFNSLAIYDLIQYFQMLTGVKMSTTALEELKANPHSFRFVSTDLRVSFPSSFFRCFRVQCHFQTLLETWKSAKLIGTFFS
jgi:hypothetical protein